MNKCLLLITTAIFCSVSSFLEGTVSDITTQRVITDYIKIDKTKKAAPAQKRYIITGGPGVGKTTIIKHLEGQGEAVIHEAATDVIKRELENGVSEPWSKVWFQEKVIALQEERQLQAASKENGSVYFDRSPIDTMTYCFIWQNEPKTELMAVQKLVDEGFYQETVFLIENLGFCQQNDVRTESLQQSLFIHEKIKESYEGLGFRVISIPFASVEDRVEMIRSCLSER
ncbi:MAG: AAA family ATPase [Rhabdochlamydiaceae bacterium]|jgi:predicted ATPase